MNSEPRTGADSLSSPRPWVETERARARSSLAAPATGGMVTSHTAAGCWGHIALHRGTPPTTTDCY